MTLITSQQSSALLWWQSRVLADISCFERPRFSCVKSKGCLSLWRERLRKVGTITEVPQGFCELNFGTHSCLHLSLISEMEIWNADQGKPPPLGWLSTRKTSTWSIKINVLSPLPRLIHHFHLCGFTPNHSEMCGKKERRTQEKSWASLRSFWKLWTLAACQLK